MGTGKLTYEITAKSLGLTETDLVMGCKAFVGMEYDQPLADRLRGALAQRWGLAHPTILSKFEDPNILVSLGEGQAKVILTPDSIKTENGAEFTKDQLQSPREEDAIAAALDQLKDHVGKDFENPEFTGESFGY